MIGLIHFFKYLLEHVLLLPSFTKKWDDIIFLHRNRAYGAYELRRAVENNQFFSLIITICIASICLCWSFWSYDDTQPYDFEFEKMVEFKGFDANLVSVKPLQKEQAPPESEKSEEEPVEEEKPKDLPPEVKADKPELKPEEKKTALADSAKKSEKVGEDVGKKYVAGTDTGMVEKVYEEGPASAYGGLAEFMKWVQQNLKVPKEAMDNNVHGTVFVHFTINEKGDLTKVTLSKGLGFGCDEAVMEVLRRAPPWKPAIRDGKAVQQRFIIPVKI